VHDVSDGDLLNFVRNTDSDRTIRQETDVVLVLPGFASVQSDFVGSLTTLRLGDDLASAFIRATNP
jgi:hypothetical protein